jgi:hypothetical protein
MSTTTTSSSRHPDFIALLLLDLSSCFDLAVGHIYQLLTLQLS